MIGVRLYLLQRLSAMIMVPLVFGHLGMIIYAVQGGLSTAEILSRTQGNVLWGVFYATFVVAASLHAAIGLRVIAYEFFGFGKSILNTVTLAIALGFSILGLRAVWAVVA